MDALKTYHQVNTEDKSISFGISRMEEIYARRKGETDQPHRHDFFTVLVIKQASGKHIVDFQEHQLGRQQIYFINPGQVHQLVEDESSVGYSLVFSSQFLMENMIPLEFVDSLNLFHDYGDCPPLTPSEEQFKKIEDYCESLLELYHSQEQMKALSMGSYLKLFLIHCNNICSINPLESNVNLTGNHILRAFKEQVNLHYKTRHSSSDYADLLNVTPDHLNRVIKSGIGKTAKEYIQSRITTAAKRLLYFSELSTKEIGYELGFSEPSNFSAFFKKCTDLSPSEFRKEYVSK